MSKMEKIQALECVILLKYLWTEEDRQSRSLTYRHPIWDIFESRPIGDIFFSLFAPLYSTWKEFGNEIRYSFSFEHELDASRSRKSFFFGRTLNKNDEINFQAVEEIAWKYQSENVGTHFESWYFEQQANQKLLNSLGENLERVIDAFVSREQRVDIQGDDVEYSIFKFEGIEGLIILGKAKVDRQTFNDHEMVFIRSIGYDHIVKVAEGIGLDTLVQDAPTNAQLDYILEQII